MIYFLEIESNALTVLVSLLELNILVCQRGLG